MPPIKRPNVVVPWDSAPFPEKPATSLNMDDDSSELTVTRTDLNHASSSTNLHEDIGEEDYNPFHALDHVHKIKCDYDLSSSTITPFDLAQYLQVMFNPLS